MVWSKMLMLTSLSYYLIDSVEMRAKIMGDRCHVLFERSPVNPLEENVPEKETHTRVVDRTVWPYYPHGIQI